VEDIVTVVGKAGDAFDLGKIFCHFAGEGRRGLCPFGGAYAIDTVVLWKVLIVAELFFYVQSEQEDAGDTHGQAQDVEEAIGPGTDEVPDCKV